MFGKPLGKNRELSGVIGESGKIGKKWGKIGNYRDSDFSQIIPDNFQLGIIGSQFWRSVLAIINHVFVHLPNIAVLSRRHHQSAIAVLRVPQNTCVITSFLRVTLRDVVTLVVHQGGRKPVHIKMTLFGCTWRAE